MSQTANNPQSIAPRKAQAVTDLLRAVVMANATAEMIKYAQDEKPGSNVNQKVLTQTIEQLQRMQREVRKGVGKTNTFFDKHLGQTKMFNLVALIDLMNRIGIEEQHAVYEEFTDLVMDLLHSVLYAQKNHGKLFFPKYKALFAMIAHEMKLDTDGEQGNVLFTRKGELYLRTGMPALPQPKIK